MMFSTHRPRQLVAPEEENAARLFPKGGLNVEPLLNQMCISYRFRGWDGDFSTSQALKLITEKGSTQNTTKQPKLRIGLMIMEDIEKFFPVKITESGGSYHFFHFMEMIVMAFTQLHEISLRLQNDVLSPSDWSPVVSVPWIFSPYMSPTELCGGPRNLNCLAADYVLGSQASTIHFRNHEGIIGLKKMEYHKFNFTDPKDKAVDRRLELAETAYGDGSGFTDGTDAVLIIQRFGCNKAGINKPWAEYIDSFPAAAWHASIMQSLSDVPRTSQERKKGIVVGYIDRQNTDRRLPDIHHEWILQYLTFHRHVDFRHLHMEEYTGHQQIVIASQCDMLIGVHGNGLTHGLWMTPHRYLIEFFYGYNYQFDYATAGQLLQHSYLGILDGEVIDSDKVKRRDVSLRQHPTRRESRQKPKNMTLLHFEEQAKPAIKIFVELAIYELSNHR